MDVVLAVNGHDRRDWEGAVRLCKPGAAVEAADVEDHHGGRGGHMRWMWRVYAVEAESAGMRTEDVMDGCGRRIVDVVTSTDGGYE